MRGAVVRAAPSVFGVKAGGGRADSELMPPGINLPKAAIAFAAAGSGLVGLGFGFLVLAFGLSESPDFSFESEQLFFVLPPLALAMFCVWLLRRYSGPMRQAGRDVRASLAALVWLGNLGLASILAFYFLDDAAAGGAQYGDVLVEVNLLWLFSATSFGVAFGCAWAIARSLRGFFALGLLAVLAVALEASEALDVWLGVDGL